MRRLFSQTIVLSLWVVLFCTLIGFAASQWWFFDLFTPFRPQALIWAVLILPLGWWLKSKPTVTLCTLIVALNLMAMGGRIAAFSPTSSQEAQADQISISRTVLFANVNQNNRDYDRLRRVVKAEAPHVVVLAETDSRWIAGIKLAEADFPYRHLEPRNDLFGMAIYADQPFTAHTHYVGALQLPLVHAEFEHYVLLAVHPIPPLNSKFALDNQLYMQTLAALTVQSQKPVLITGDFNASLWSHALQPLAGNNIKSLSPSGWGYTWPTKFWPLATQIDHAFIKNIPKGKTRILGDIGSDHYPILTHMELSGRSVGK